MKKILAFFFALMLIPVSALAAGFPMVGAEAPDFEIELINGESFKLSDQRGKIVLINIWASWCGPCVAEMPDIDQLAKDYADDLVIIGVNCGEPEQTVIDFIEENGYSYLSAADENYYISGMLYPSDVIPYTIVIDRDGIITQLHRGGGVGMYEILEEYVLDAMNTIKATDKGIKILA